MTLTIPGEREYMSLLGDHDYKEHLVNINCDHCSSIDYPCFSVIYIIFINALIYIYIYIYVKIYIVSIYTKSY